MRTPRALVRGALRRLTGKDTEGFVVFPEGADTSPLKKAVFFREFTRFHGGHLKHFHYYEHVAASGTYVPFVVFTADSLWDASNPWKREGLRVLPRSEVAIEPDLYFLAGRDWGRLDPRVREDSPVPVINFLQHVRHGDASKEHYSYLKHKAIRVCVDPAVEEAARRTGLVRGPIFTIQNGIDIRIVGDAHSDARELDVLIVAVKRPEIGRRLHARLTDVNAKLVDALVPRPDLMRDIENAKVTLFLPNPEEGAYLPPMEGMALGTIVICPDHVGTSYVRDGENSYRPRYEDDEVLGAVRRALALPASERDALLSAGFATVRSLDLGAERAQFLDILRRVDQLWRDA